MHKYIARRILLIIPTLLVLSLLIFFLMRVLPGDVALMILSGGGEGSVFIDEKAMQLLRERLGLLDPLPVQYLHWVWNAARGDLGNSLYSGRSVISDILLRLPVTVEISLLAVLLSVVVGIPAGVVSAVKHNSWVDQLVRLWSVIFLAVPSFWLGLMVILAGAIYFKWMPPLGYHSLWSDPETNFKQVLWPVLILGLNGVATIARMTRSTMLEVMREDYIRTARAKGILERTVITRHALKNALIPVVTLAGLQLAVLMGGTVILEQIFAIPGIGSLFIGSIYSQDYPIVQGGVVVFAVIFMLINLLVDTLYAWLDPRVSYN